MEAAALWSEWDAGWSARGRRSDKGLASADEALRCMFGRQHLADDEAALAVVLDQLYASEIDVHVVHAADRWACEVGHEACPAVPVRVLLDWLPSAACRAFPQSEYARRFIGT